MCVICFAFQRLSSITANVSHRLAVLNTSASWITKQSFLSGCFAWEKRCPLLVQGSAGKTHNSSATISYYSVSNVTEICITVVYTKLCTVYCITVVYMKLWTVYCITVVYTKMCTVYCITIVYTKLCTVFSITVVYTKLCTVYCITVVYTKLCTVYRITVVYTKMFTIK